MHLTIRLTKHPQWHFFLAKFHSASAATKYWCWFTLPRVHVICFLCQSCNFPDTYRYTFPCQKCLFILCDKTVEVCGSNRGKPKVSMSCLCLIICESICDRLLNTLMVYQYSSGKSDVLWTNTNMILLVRYRAWTEKRMAICQPMLFASVIMSPQGSIIRDSGW